MPLTKENTSSLTNKLLEVKVVATASQTREPLVDTPSTSHTNEMQIDEVFGNQVQYQIGSRKPGDKLISTAIDSVTWEIPHDVTATVTYPKTDEDDLLQPKVTCIVIEVTQSVISMQTRLICGGIGQRHIKFDIAAPVTTVFNYTASLYGV